MPKLALFFHDPLDDHQFFLRRNDTGEAETVICRWSNGGKDGSWSVADFLTDRGAANDKLRELLKADDAHLT